MENIREAVERARIGRGVRLEQNNGSLDSTQPRADSHSNVAGEFAAPTQEVALSGAHLQSNRIISHIVSDPRTKLFDMLRTQILQTMDLKGWKTIAITSPTVNCGKTLTALNLAISIARQPERSVLLVDLDFQRPSVARYLGVEPSEVGALAVLQGRTALSRAIIRAHIDDQKFSVLLSTSSIVGSSEVMASRAMASMMKELKASSDYQTIIIDLPPILTTDDVITILPQVDCVLLVTAVGTSTVTQIEECKRHLQSTEVIRVILNKVPEASTNYGYDY